jgi:glutamate-ammonia-ligase adenylyltransferase
MNDTTDDRPASHASRWRTRIAQARPASAARIDALASRPIDRTAIGVLMIEARGEAWRDEAHLRAGLRQVRILVLAALIDRDLDGRADACEVMAATTSLAEIAIAEALCFHAEALAAIHGVPRGHDRGTPQDLLVVGMGKLGGGELNVSSDIDLIFVYDEDGATHAEAGATVRSIANAEFFTRLGRKLIASLSEVTGDGFVFRVDMRLRPDGESGPLVTHFSMLEHYLVGSARDWERFAWIKARVVSPPVFGQANDDALARLVTPFVYRRYLDFGAIDALRKLHGQIRDEAARREAARRVRSTRRAPGAPDIATTRIDVKLGRGGIREIEFIAQHFQLIRGGRDPSLRLRPTVATLTALVDHGLISPEVGRQLREAYLFLRNVEHRLQYLDDAQTHTLPARDAVDDCVRIGVMCESLIDAGGRRGFDGLIDTLERHRRLVSTQFDAVFGLDDAEPDTVSPDTMRLTDLWNAFSEANPLHAPDETAAAAVRARLETMGFAPPDDAFARLVALARSARLRAIPATARARLDALVPRLIDASASQEQPTATLARWFDLIEAIAGRSAYLALLAEFPDASRAVTRLLSASPWAAQYLTRHPLLLDELIDAPENDRVPRDAAAWSLHWQAVKDTLTTQLAATANDAERQMDVLREMHHGETFRLLIEDLEGHLTIEMLSDQLSALADLTLEATLVACWSQFVAARPDDTTLPARPAFAVIAYGKLGGKELGYASDLDLVFLFDQRADPDPELAPQRYARFAQRLNLWLTARTTAGALFDIDLRLRPDGAAGLVVTSFDAWSKYERREHDVGAGTWEHQALTRARFCAGDRTLGDAFERERLAILGARRRDAAGRATLRAEIVAMRAKMHDGHPNRSAEFDLKHDEGGMVDIEFAVQYLVLGYGADHRELLDNVGNIALLARASAAGLVDADCARAVGDAYRRYRASQHASRLADPGARAARVDAGEYVAERSTVRRLWHHLFGDAAS